MTSHDTVLRLQVLGIYLALTGLLVAVSIAAADGHLIYTLDDPYIHLAVAENILRGGYGVNFPEPSAPSSSILYPLLLAGALRLGLSDLGPLLLGVAAYAAAIWFAVPLVRRSLGEVALGGFPRRVLITSLLLLLVNAVALPMTGMEHPIHVLATVLVVSGIVGLSDGEGPGWRLALGVVFCCLIRFEGLALGGAVIVLLFAIGHRRMALALALIVGAALAVHAAVMAHLGLPFLPSSVMVKSSVSADAMGRDLVGTINGLAVNTAVSLQNRWGILFALTAALLLPSALERSPRSYLARVAVVALVAQVVGGRFGWFGRYEVYGVALMTLSALVYGGERVRALRLAVPVGVVAVALMALATPYVVTTVLMPGGSRNIYQQQFQMHRFAAELFPETVAVNDLGWVAFRNDNYVLDLWGLGSEEARLATRDGGLTVDFMRGITARHGVVYAMLYDAVFAASVPPEWCRIAELQTPVVTSAYDLVGFYLLVPEEEAAMRRALAELDATLPRGAALRTFDCAGGWGAAPAS